MTAKPQIAILMLIVMLIAVAPVAAFQEAAKKDDATGARAERRAKALALIDEIIKDTQSLRLPENRLRILMQTANAVWPVDEKRARLLIKTALETLKQLQAAADNNDSPYSQPGQFAAQIRSELLSMLAERDPELALEVLHATRQGRDGQASVAQNISDTQMELQLAQALVTKDAPKALALAEQGLASGVTQGVVNVVTTLSDSNREAAQKLFDEMLARLHSENYATNPTAAYIALNLLREWMERRNQANPPSAEVTGIARLKFDEAAARDLCSTFLRALLDNSSGASTSGRVPWGNTFDLLRQLQPMLPAIEKLVPSQAPTLQARAAEMQRIAEMQNGPWAKVQEMVNTAPVADLLTAAANLPPEVQNSIIQSAAWKAFNEGNSDVAQQIIQEKIADPRSRQEMQANLDRQLADRLMNEGKVAEARARLMRLPLAAERADYLKRLAWRMMEKEDKNEARQLLDEAQAQVSDRAENYQTLYVQLEIADLYRILDPPRGYMMIETAIDRLNELTTAAATLNGFDVSQYFRSDEFVLMNGNSLNQLLQQIGAQVSGVAEKDADRARAMADRVERSEMRIWLRFTIFSAMLGDNQSKRESIHLAPPSLYRPVPHLVGRSGLMVYDR
jgi:hypothetical protein